MKNRLMGLAALILLLVVGTGNASAATAKYIFYFIGDGMGHEHIELARQLLGDHADMLRAIPRQGTLGTVNAAGKITDSAAAGTALACGVKTENGRLGTTPDGASVDSIMKSAQRAGRRTGVVASVCLNHATPAAFYAHVKSRTQYDDIACQIADSGLDFLGGGTPNFSANFDRDGWAKKLAASGYTVTEVQTAQDFASVKPGGKHLVCHPWEYREIDKSRIGGGRQPSLADYTALAIRQLDNPAGFVLMVEGSKIDHAAHNNDGPAMLVEMSEFNAAIREAMKFYQAHPDETVIVVTADHNTGGLYFTGTVPDGYDDTGLGISSERFLSVLNKVRPDQFENFVRALNADSVGLSKSDLALGEQVFKSEANPKKRAAAVCRALWRKHDTAHHVAWKNGSHQASDVDYLLLGKGTEDIQGALPNHELVRKLKKAGGLE